jgi:hypothetical protein
MELDSLSLELDNQGVSVTPQKLSHLPAHCDIYLCNICLIDGA